MENKNNVSSTVKRSSSESSENTAETLGDTIVAVLDKLAGKKSDLKLTFQDLTFDAGAFKTKMSGSIVLESTFAKEVDAL